MTFFPTRLIRSAAPVATRACRHLAIGLLVSLPAILAVSLVAGADEHPPTSEMERPSISAGKIEQISDDELLLTGDVDLRYGEMRLLADRVNYNDKTRAALAEGNVVLMFGKSQISGDRLEMNVETRLATIWNAHGYMDPDVIFDAEKLERIAEDKVVITDGTVTTCTQPTPYWAFHVSKATLQVGHYAYMRNVEIKSGKAPVFYLPYLIWPMKSDRATGLLLPNVGYSRTRGSFIGNAFYVVLGRSQDTTLFYDLYGRTGTGLGFDYRFVPAPKGEGSFTGYYLHDTFSDGTSTEQERPDRRYRFRLREDQRFGSGFRLLADLNKVSDLDYYLDFERDITQTTSPTVFSQIDLSRNWSNYSLNVNLDRQEQFLSANEDLTLQKLPEIEARGRGIRFGRSPFYLSFVSSAAVLTKHRNLEVLRSPSDPNIILGPDETVAVSRDTVYQRYDLFPSISASLSPTSWLDISPSVSARETVYTRGLFNPLDQDSGSGDKDVKRGYAAFNLSVVGPRFFRLFGDPLRTDASVFKHTFEPHVVYTYVPEVTGGERVIRFDEVDALRGDVNEVTYSLTSRLFEKKPSPVSTSPAHRPGEPVPTDLAGPTEVATPVTDVKDLPQEMKEALKDQTRAPGVGAVEVATFDLSQAWSLDKNRPISMAAPVEPDGTVRLLESQAGPIVATVRYNPTAAASLDVRASYDILFDDIRTVSLSANLRSLEHGYMRLSWFLERDLAGRFVDPNGESVLPNDPNGDLRFFDQSQVRLIGGTAFLKRKVTLDVEGSYDIEGHDLRDQRYRVGYNTQCCGMLVEVARRNFETIDEIEYRFVLNLRGVGTFLDLQGRPR